VEQFRESSQHRLTTIFHQITDLKTQLLKRQRQLQQLEERIRRVSNLLTVLLKMFHFKFFKEILFQ
jgi:hypothetical protein